MSELLRATIALQEDSISMLEKENQRLKAGFESEEDQDYVHNEVTGLHNEADLREIQSLRAALEEIAGDNDLKQFKSWAQAVAREALQESER